MALTVNDVNIRHVMAAAGGRSALRAALKAEGGDYGLARIGGWLPKGIPARVLLDHGSLLIALERKYRDGVIAEASEYLGE